MGGSGRTPSGSAPLCSGAAAQGFSRAWSRLRNFHVARNAQPHLLSASRRKTKFTHAPGASDCLPCPMRRVSLRGAPHQLLNLCLLWPWDRSSAESVRKEATNSQNLPRSPQQSHRGVVVSTSALQAEDLGSIPGGGIYVLAPGIRYLRGTACLHMPCWSTRRPPGSNPGVSTFAPPAGCPHGARSRAGRQSHS